MFSSQQHTHNHTYTNDDASNFFTKLFRARIDIVYAFSMVARAAHTPAHQNTKNIVHHKRILMVFSTTEMKYENIKEYNADNGYNHNT